MDDFVNILCENFTRYQRKIDGVYQIVPRVKKKQFLNKIVCAEECVHLSEIGSGKTKVILPLLCQICLSNNVEAHEHLARGGKPKTVLVILVPEHVVHDACAQVYWYCLNLNLRDLYRIFDDIFALMPERVSLKVPTLKCRDDESPRKSKETIFITFSFNSFKAKTFWSSPTRSMIFGPG